MRRFLDRLLTRFFLSRPGVWMASVAATVLSHGVLSRRAQVAFRYDLLRLKARRLDAGRELVPASPRLHLGCGENIVPGFVNVDVEGLGEKVDLASGHLPWPDASFEVAVGLHVIEHLDFGAELLPMLKELRRVMKAGGEVWLSCPDMERLCRSYIDRRGEDLREDKIARFGDIQLREFPPQHTLNILIYQKGQHQVLLDFELLSWALSKAGFGPCTHLAEADFLKRFPEFPPRNDDLHSLYIRAMI